eukprot:317638-Chlamydomonas_euryale.AAC.1
MKTVAAVWEERSEQERHVALRYCRPRFPPSSTPLLLLTPALLPTHSGVDMTPEQLDVAVRNLDAYTRDVCKFSKPNMKFVRGEIEYLDK